MACTWSTGLFILIAFLIQVDVLYLHNAEESQRAQLGDQAFTERLKAAFEWLEKARSSGKIQVRFAL